MNVVKQKKIVMTHDEILGQISLGNFRTPLALLHCNWCSIGTGNVVDTNIKDYPWCMELSCGDCGTTWLVCKHCRNARTWMQKHNHLLEHNRLHARKSGKSKSQAFENATQSCVSYNQRERRNVIVASPLNERHEEEELFNDAHGWIDVPPKSNLGFAESTMQSFFKFMFASSSTHHDLPCMPGMEYLVKRSEYQQQFNPKLAGSCYIPPHQVVLKCRIAELAFQNTASKREAFVKTCLGIYKLGCEDGYHAAAEVINEKFNQEIDEDEGKCTNYIRDHITPAYSNEASVPRGRYEWGIRIPSTVNDLRHGYLEAPDSFIKNLPHPKVMTDIDKHAYVSVIDVLRLFCALPDSKFCKGYGYPGKDGTVSYISQSPRACEILKKADTYATSNKIELKLVSGIRFWGDDCDAGSSGMQGRANVWLKTMTIVNPFGDTNRFQNTFPIAVGTKGASHDEVEERINADLEKLANPLCLDPFYMGAVKKQCYCYFHVEYESGDQPERRNRIYFMEGNSTYCARFGISADHANLYEKLRSCSSCYTSMKERLENEQWSIPTSKCSKCLNWDAMDNLYGLNLTRVPDKYPINMNGDGTFNNVPPGRLVRKSNQVFLQPFVVTFESMNAALDLAHEGFLSKNWKIGECEVFLKVEGINLKLIKQFKQHANRSHLLETTIDELKADLLQMRMENPEMFARVPKPSTWIRSGVEMKHHLEAIMHLLLHGVTKDTMELIDDTLTRKYANSSFATMVKEHIKPLLEIKCNWLKLRQYGLGNYIAENYLAYARIAPWLYQNYKDALPDVNPEKDMPKHDLPLNNWTAKNLKYWLRVRGLKVNGDKLTLLVRVKQYIEGEKTEPPLLPIPKIEFDDISGLVSSLHRMLECCMSHKSVTKSRVLELETSVKVFITSFDKIDTELRKPEDTKRVIRKPNFLCLLNLPYILENFGPLPYLWEGKLQGEAYLPRVKSTYYGGMLKSENWPQHMLESLYKQKCFSFLLNNVESKVSDINELNGLRQRSREFHKHSCYDEVKESIGETKLHRKKPVGVILVHGDVPENQTRLFVVITGVHLDLVEIQVENMTRPTAKCGFDYFKYNVISFEDEVLTWEKLFATLKKFRIGYGVLLPLLDGRKEDEGGRLFALISSTWVALSHKNRLSDLLVQVEE